MAETMGQRLRKLRGNQTQLNVAKAVGVDNSVLSRIESDDKKKLDPDVINKLAEYHDVSVGYILNGDPRTFTETATGDPIIPPEEREFLDWVKEHVTGQFFYDFHQSQDKDTYMESLKLVWKMEKGREPGQKQGE